MGFFPSFDDLLPFLQIVDNPADVAEKADRIITMLPSSPNVIEVYTGANGILKYTLSAHTYTDYNCNMYGSDVAIMDLFFLSAER